MDAVPHISVVMAACNDSRHLPDTIESVLAQDLRGFELIVVDDGSTDGGVAAVLADWARRDARVRPFRQDNTGLTRALVRGCAEARGQYIARIDAGDTIVPRRLRLQSEALDASPQCVFVSCWTAFFGPDWEFLFEQRTTPTPDGPVSILASDPDDGVVFGPTSHGSVMFRRDAYEEAGGYRPAFYYGQDWDLWYRLAEQGKFAVIEETLYRARVFPDGLSAGREGAQRRIGRYSRAALASRLRGDDEAPWLARARQVRPAAGARRSRRRLAAGHYFIGSCLQRRGDPRQRVYLGRAARLDPLMLRAWCRLAWSLVRAPRAQPERAGDDALRGRRH